MHEYRIILTWEAIYDVIEIVDYIEKEFGIDRADQFTNDIQRELMKLSLVGMSLSKTQFFYRGYSIHKKPYPPSVIFYILLEDVEEIHILRILREEQDQDRIFGGDHEYTYPEDGYDMV